jgi:hypothetical protein
MMYINFYTWKQRAGVAQSVYLLVMGWTIGVRGFDYRRKLENFLFVTASRLALGSTQLPIQWVPRILSLLVKRPVREADHSSPSCAQIKMRGAIPPLQYVFMAWCLLKHRYDYTVTHGNNSRMSRGPWDYGGLFQDVLVL